MFNANDMAIRVYKNKKQLRVLSFYDLKKKHAELLIVLGVLSYLNHSEEHRCCISL